MKKGQDYYARVLSCLMFGHPGRYKDHHMDKVMAETETPQLIDEFREKLLGILSPHYEATKGKGTANPEQNGFTPGITTGEGGVIVPESPEQPAGGNDAPGSSGELQPGEIPSAPAQAPAPAQPRIESRTETLPNGRACQSYTVSLDALVPALPEGVRLSLTDDGGTGLTLNDERLLQGIPPKNGSFELQLSGTNTQGEETLKLTLKLALIPNSRDLWKDISPDPEAPYAKPVEDAARVAIGQGWHMVMGSQRGRSHAHRGDHRDDHGVIDHTDNGWHLLVIGDGAGSCPYSRQGSLLATTAARDALKMTLSGESGHTLESAALAWWATGETTRMTQQIIGALHNTVISAVHKGFKAIEDEAKASERSLKAFSTTLLLALHKVTSQGHLVVTFGIGDGAIAALPERGQAQLMNAADSGQHAGQTRFLDGQLFQDGQGLYQRLRVQVLPTLEALVLATDGVTDPKFDSDNDMQEGASWWSLYDELAPALEAPGEGERDPLLDYLNFFIERHHDDRTVAVLYRNSADSDEEALEHSEAVSHQETAGGQVTTSAADTAPEGAKGGEHAPETVGSESEGKASADSSGGPADNGGTAHEPAGERREAEPAVQENPESAEGVKHE